MRHTTPPRTLAVAGLLGALAATASLPLIGSRAGSGWPPHPKQIVQFVEEREVAVAPEGFFDVYHVSANETLVVESLVVTSPETNVFTLCGFEPFEELGGVLQRKGLCNGTGGVGSGTGAVFRPGSKIVVQNVTGVRTTVVTISLVGYLRR
jgi:hypothetical protein